MKIAHLIDAISDSGVTRVVRTLTRTMTAQGDDALLLMCRDPLNLNPDDDVSDYIKLPLGETDQRSKLFGSRVRDMRYAVQDSKVLDLWMQENGVDFVFIHGLVALRFHHTTSPHAIVAHSTKSKMLLPGRWSPFRWAFQRLYRKVYTGHPIVAVSEGVRRDLIENFGVTEDNSKAIYNPFDRDVIRKLAEQTPSDIPSRPYFVAAGRAVRAKRFDIMIRAFAKSGIKADLIILGQGRKFGRYKRLAKRLDVGERVIFLGFRDNPYPYYKFACAMILSSDYEGYPSGLVEALICGTPVVSTDCPSGPSEALTGSLAAYLAPVGDVNALAAKIQKVAHTPYDYPEPYLDVFDPQRIANAYKEFAKSFASR